MDSSHHKLSSFIYCLRFEEEEVEKKKYIVKENGKLEAYRRLASERHLPRSADPQQHLNTNGKYE